MCSKTLTGLSLVLPGAVLSNATRRLGDRQSLILRQRVRGSVRAVRAVRNTRLIQTETRVVADGVGQINTVRHSFNLGNAGITKRPPSVVADVLADRDQAILGMHLETKIK
jgi:hypothetical protein